MSRISIYFWCVPTEDNALSFQLDVSHSTPCAPALQGRIAEYLGLLIAQRAREFAHLFGVGTHRVIEVTGAPGIPALRGHRTPAAVLSPVSCLSAACQAASVPVTSHKGFFFCFLGGASLSARQRSAPPKKTHGPGPRGLRAHAVSTHPQLVLFLIYSDQTARRRS
jgi:hypothetical protein